MDIQIPAQEPGERADRYLFRIRSWGALQDQTKKEIARQERRIRAEVEQALIYRAVKEACKKPREAPGAFIKNPRGPRYYRIPDNLWILLIFAPLYLLSSIIWQDKNRREGPRRSAHKLKK